jgi:hypothetical protein
VSRSFSKQDFVGQKTAEEIYRKILIIAGVCALSFFVYLYRILSELNFTCPIVLSKDCWHIGWVYFSRLSDYCIDYWSWIICRLCCKFISFGEQESVLLEVKRYEAIGYNLI